MTYKNYDCDESIKAILAELSDQSSTIETNNIIEEEKEDDKLTKPLTREDLEEFILKNGAKTVSTTQNIIATLLKQIQITPDAELIESVAEMVSSNNKALETLAKLHLNNEKLKQAKELEQFKQQTKLQISDNMTNRPQLSREDVMNFLINAEPELKLAKKEQKEDII